MIVITDDEREGIFYLSCGQYRSFWRGDLLTYHRIDGPAQEELENGEPTGRGTWWINDHCVDARIRGWARDRNIDLDNLSEMDKMVIAMEWSGFRE